MIEHERRSLELEAVLDAYASETSSADPQELAGWVRQYPKYRRELMEFAAARSLSQRVRPEHEPEEDEDTLIARGMAVLDQVLGAQARQPVPLTVMKDLYEAARAQGMSARELADAIGLSVPLVAKLHRRLLRVATIPLQLIDALADVLRYSPEAVSAYLRQPPVLATGANYRAEQAPSLAAQQDFLEAVQSDATLEPADRQRWIDLARARGEE